jgi:hypothetical protein
VQTGAARTSGGGGGAPAGAAEPGSAVACGGIRMSGQTHVRTQPEKGNGWVPANPRGAGGRASTSFLGPELDIKLSQGASLISVLGGRLGADGAAVLGGRRGADGAAVLGGPGRGGGWSADGAVVRTGLGLSAGKFGFEIVRACVD